MVSPIPKSPSFLRYMSSFLKSFKYKKENNKVITITDTGIGIDENDIPFIFERFYRTDISRQRKTGGSGIGLTIVKSIVKAHNGKIEVESKKGKGSKFTITL